MKQFQLIEAGANVFRFNFSHGDHEEQLARMNMVREAVEKTGKDVGILLDTKGAEIRTTVQDTTDADYGRAGYIEFNVGDETRISMDPEHKGTKEKSLLLTQVCTTTRTSVDTSYSMMA